MILRRSIAPLVAVILLAGCAGNAKDVKTTPQDAAASVATALSEGNLDGVEIRQGDPAADLPVLLGGMDGLRPQVTVAHVSASTQSAQLKLAYSWPLSSPWTYEADATLTRENEKWKLNWAPTVLHPKLTDTTRLERQRGEDGERGNITGNLQAVLVENTPVQMLGLNKTGLSPEVIEDSARQVAEKAAIDPAAYLAKVHEAGADAFVDATAVRTDELPADFLAIRGADLRTVTIPAPKTSGYARALLGTLGYATPEQAQEAGGGVAPGDLIGVSGLQRTYDHDLRGTSGSKVFLAPRDTPAGSGRPTNATLLADFPEVPGRSLATTIDDPTQTAAEEALKSLQVPASIVVLQTGTGAILAAADSPEARRKDDSMTENMGPGLAASPIAALALMRSGVDLQERLTCEKEVTVGAKQFVNAKDYSGTSGQLTLARAMRDDCVTAVATASQRLDGAQLPEAAKSLGLGQNLDLGVPLTMGSFPAPPDAMAKAEALVGEGGGRVSSSALALATMAASVQAKQAVSPFLVPGRQPTIEGAAPLSDAEAKALQDLMKSGAGSYPSLTGAVTGHSDGRAWLVGYSGDRAVAVVLGDAERASTTPAQLVRALPTR